MAIVLDTPKLALFLVQFYEDGGEKPFDWTYFWDPVGGDSLSEKAPSKEPRKPIQSNQPGKTNTSN